MIEVNTRKAIQDIRRALKDLTPDEVRTVISRAENKTVSIANTEARKRIRQAYKISAGVLAKAVKVKKATKATLTATILANASSVPLSAFSPRKTRLGVSVKIKTNRVLIKHAFLYSKNSGSIGVFARGRYVGNEFQFRKERIVKGKLFKMINGKPVPIDAPDMPITELNTLSIPVMFQEKTVESSVQQKIETYFPERLIHEVMYLLEKRNSM